MSKRQPKKRFGQNFLQDQSIINAIVSHVKLKENERLIEIGPGRGALTQYLLQNSPKLDVIEIDRDLVDYLSRKFSEYPQLTIHSQDVLRFDFNKLVQPEEQVFVIGNLPYNISTELLFYLSALPYICNMVFMLQKEVVDRICALPGTTNYSRLSVGLQHKYVCSHLLDVPKECFYPIPQVESAVIRLRRRSEILPVDEKLFNQVVTTAFNQRRKCLRNSLANLLDFTDNNVADKISQYVSMRPQELSVADFVNITNLIAS